MSVKVPRSGMRGTPFPRFLTAFANRLVLRQFRRGGARTQGGLHTLLLETVGARSGATRQAVLGYLEESPESWLVIASMAGASRHPACTTWQSSRTSSSNSMTVVASRSGQRHSKESSWRRRGRALPSTHLST
jgi:hypothetical protein